MWGFCDDIDIVMILTVDRTSWYNGQYKALPGATSALNFQILDPHWLCPEIWNSKPDILENRGLLKAHITFIVKFS